jgi:predicted nucleotidyltransferase
VTDDGDAIFTPCRYGVAAVTFARGAPVDDLRAVVSFRGRFSDQAQAGERIEARGSLERVEPRDGPAYHRLVVGGSEDYLKSGR